MENFALNPIFAVHSKNGIGLPDSIMVVRLFLVQFVLVRIQVGQQKKDPHFADLFLFSHFTRFLEVSYDGIPNCQYDYGINTIGDYIFNLIQTNNQQGDARQPNELGGILL